MTQPHPQQPIPSQQPSPAHQQWPQQQGPYPPHGYYPQVVHVVHHQPQAASRGDAIAALVFGLVAMVIPLAHLALAVICALIAVIEGCVGISRKQGGMAVAGLILGSFALLLSIVYAAYPG
jgi:hypothetical protein